jgi:hypothetical protein
VHDLSGQELIQELTRRDRPRHGAENVMRKQTALLSAVAAFALGGLMGASALLPERPASDRA